MAMTIFQCGPMWTDPLCYLARAHALTHTHLGAANTCAHEKQIQMEMRANTHRIKAPGCAPTHTNSTERVMRNSSSSLAVPVSALCKQRPVVDAPDIWVLFFLCVRVRVCACAWIAAGTPLG